MSDDGFTAEAVVQAALDLLDDAGLNGFTMRALATRLGTYPTTIYWHVGGRSDVLSAVGALVLDRVAAEARDPGTTPWDEWLTENAHAYRRAMQAHPAVATWVVTHFEAGVPVPDYLELMISVLSRAGFRGAQLAEAYNAYLGSLAGWVGMEMIRADPDRGWDPARMESSVRGLSADHHPTIVANLDHLANHAFTFRWEGGTVNPLDEAFEFAVVTWVEGLRAMLPAV